MAYPNLRPSFVLFFISGIVLALVYTTVSPLFERAVSAMERRQARATQLAMARSAVNQHAALKRRITLLEHLIDERELFRHVPNADVAQRTVQDTIRAATQSGGLIINTLDSRMDAMGSSYYKLTTHVATSGSFNAITATLNKIEEIRPRLLIRDIHIRSDGDESTDELEILKIDLDIDSYVDIIPT